MSMRGSTPRKRGRPCKASRMPRGGLKGENKENIDIGNEYVRWRDFKQEKKLKTDEEVAKQLLDHWEGKKKMIVASGLSLSKATQQDLENLQSKTKQSADEVIRFFLELDVEPGQTAIVVGRVCHQAFESLKSNLSLQNDDLMAYLLEVHARHSKSGSPEFENVEEGIWKGKRVTRSSGRFGAHNEEGGFTESQETSAYQKNKDLSQEATKKRSRKSLPQRVITELDITDFDIEGGGKKMKASDSLDDADTPSQYNYIMKAKVPITGPITNQSTGNTDVPANTMIDVENLAASMAENLAASLTETIPSAMYDTMSAKDLEAYGIVKFGQYTVTRDVEGLYSCPFCDHKTSIITRLKRHITMHTGGEYKCPMCDRSYTDKYKLKEHIQVKHEQSVHYSCDLCDKVFTSKGGLRYHRRKIHSMDFDYWCDFCLKGFNQYLSYEVHMSKHKGTMEYKCTTCSRDFPDPATLSTHRQTCVPKLIEVAQLNPETGTYSLKSNPDVKEKVSIDQCNPSWFRCACGTEFKWRAMFDNHRAQCIKSGIEKKTDGAGGPDSLMLKDDNKSNLQQIRSMEEGERLFYEATRDDDSQSNGIILECQLCNYKTSKMSHLKRHELTHARKKYPCNDCCKSFSDPERLKTHQRAKHKGPCKYKCDKCSRTFLSKGGIMYHQQTQHNNSYKYRCETCDKGFNTIQHYLGHKNTHSGQRPFICEKCNVGFAYPSVLSSHKRVCKGKIEGVNMDGRLDLYPCKECKEKFAMFSSLQEHMQECHGEPGKNRYLCECGADFELWALYELHKSKCTMPNKSMELILQNVKDEVEKENIAEMDIKQEPDGFLQQNLAIKEESLEKTGGEDNLSQTSQSDETEDFKKQNASGENSEQSGETAGLKPDLSGVNKTTVQDESHGFRLISFNTGQEGFGQVGQTPGPDSFSQFVIPESFRHMGQFAGPERFMHVGQAFGPEVFKQMNQDSFRQILSADGSFRPIGQNLAQESWHANPSLGPEGWQMNQNTGQEGFRQMGSFVGSEEFRMNPPSGPESFMQVNPSTGAEHYKPVNPRGEEEGFQQLSPDKFNNVISTQPVFPL